MGVKDEYQFDYLDDDRRFADQINGGLFHGRQIVKPEELTPADVQAVYLGKEAKRRENPKVLVDKARMWRGRQLHILVVENQNYVDYQMVMRNMLSESLGYHKQWKRRKREHAGAGDLRGGKDEYLSGIKKDEKFIPIITLVVYYGIDHSWDGARCLHDLLEIDEELKDYVTNYKLNLYDCHEHDTFEEYQSSLRQVFETIRYAKDKEKLCRILDENYAVYSRIDADTRELLSVVANVRIPETCKVIENGEERYNMCKAFEDMRLEGMEEGIEKGIYALIQTCTELGVPKDVILSKCMEKFELTNERAQSYIEKC